MYTPREKVFWFSITSRLTVVTLQFVFNSVCPDHNADAFRAPRSSTEQISILDKWTDGLLGGLTRWDSQYFIHIAKYGYTYENSLAFFPLFPFSVSCVAGILKFFLFLLNEHSVVTISAVVINFTCFVVSAITFYNLSERVLGCANAAYKAAILYCVNPASIFFSAAYSESMFACLTFYSMLASIDDRTLIYIPIGLSALVRSNGLINIGFPLFAWLKNWFSLELPIIAHDYKSRGKKKALVRGLTRTFISLTKLLYIIFLSLVPFVLFQIYIYVSFCTDYHRAISVADHVSSFALANGLTMPGNRTIDWCRDSLPNIYSKIQEKYWNVGFMKYYQWKQIPNFILAGPILYIMIKCVVQYFAEHKRVVKNFVKQHDEEDSKDVRLVHLPAQAFVFVVHGLFLTLFCIVFVHIQVSTRLLASASPLPYWYCASIMSHKNCTNDNPNENYEQGNNAFSRWRVFFMTQKRYTITDISILMYFLGYLILGSFMYANFLPWT